MALVCLGREKTMPKAFSKIKEALLFSTVIFDGNERMLKQVDEDNRQVAVIWSLVEIAFWVLCLFLSLNDPIFERCRPLYSVILVLTGCTLIFAQYLASKWPKLIRPLIYTMQLILLGAGIGLAIFQWELRSATFIAAVLIVPVMFITNTLPTIVNVVACSVVLMIVGPHYIEPEVFSWTQKTLLIFSIAGILIGHVINKARFERYAFEEAALELAALRHKFAYYDQLTGLQNRRAYSERIEENAHDAQLTGCIVSADINGLKQTNDTFGHSAGDELITGAAQCLSACFEGAGEVYRLGGDEFCVITTETQEEVEKRLLQLEQVTANWKGRYVDGISLSYGVAIMQQSQDMDFALREADRKMYEHKRNYYLESGKDRRHLPV